MPTSFAQPVYCTIPADEYFPNQYYLHNTGQMGLADVDIDADSAWVIALSDSGVIMAVIDAGIAEHPDLSGVRLLQGWDFVGPNHLYPVGDDDPTPFAYEAHGIATAGIMAASHNSEGIVGVCGAGYVLPVKISDDTGRIVRNSNKVAEAFRYASAQHARVILCGITFNSKYRDTAISSAVIWAAECRSDTSFGSVIVFPAGNEADRGVPSVDYQWPAGLDEAIAVGAVSKWGERWDYSCFGHELDFMAPSGNDGDYEWEIGDVWTDDGLGWIGYNPELTGWGDAGGDLDYTSRFGGTSAAAPQVAGTIALILARRPDLYQAHCRPLDSVYSILSHTSDDIPPAGFDTLTGFGRVSAYWALLSVSRGDFNNDGAIDVLDVVRCVNIAFRGGAVADNAWHPAVQDPKCDGVCSVADVVALVNVAFRGQSPEPPCYIFDY